MVRVHSWRENLGSRYAYLIVLVCIINMMLPCAMILSCIGIFITPVTTYFGIAKAEFSLSFAILCATMMVSLPLTGKLTERFGMRRVLPICILLCGAGCGAMGFSQAVWHFYLCGIIIGLGMPGLIYLSVPTLIGNWFKGRIGFFVGLCMAFTGIGGAIFNALGTALMQGNPEGWKTTYLVFAAIILLISLPATLLLVYDSPEDLGLLAFGAAPKKDISQTSVANTVSAASMVSDASTGRSHATNNTSQSHGISAKDALHMPEFFALALFSGIITLNQTIYQFFASYALSFSETFPTIAAVSGLIASSAMIGQAIGKVVLGFINDRSIRAATALGILSGIVGLALMWAFPSILAILLLGAFLFGLVYAMTTVQTPLLVRKVFGQKDYALIYSRVSMVGSLLSTVAAVFWSFIVDGPGGYPLMFTLGFICMATCLALAFFSLRGVRQSTSID